MVTKTMVGQLETIFQHVSLPAIPTKNPKKFPWQSLFSESQGNQNSIGSF
jgi:hypothetical protein